LLRKEEKATYTVNMFAVPRWPLPASRWSLCPQLAGNAHSDMIGGFPGERWAQTANYGYSPNPALPNTFMAVAMDLPDFSSPYGT